MMEEWAGRLEEAMTRLAEAQARSGAGKRRLDEAMSRLAEARAQTEAMAERTQEILPQLVRQMESVVADIEDIAYIVLHDVLKREFGWEVGVLERTWQRWNGEIEEINVFGRAADSARPEQTIWIVGEAKHNISLREVEQFARLVERARRHLEGEVYAVCFAYRARPEVRARLEELRIPLLFSYGRFA